MNSSAEKLGSKKMKEKRERIKIKSNVIMKRIKLIRGQPP